jgi:hypothetical protein
MVLKVWTWWRVRRWERRRKRILVAFLLEVRN